MQGECRMPLEELGATAGSEILKDAYCYGWSLELVAEKLPSIGDLWCAYLP